MWSRQKEEALCGQEELCVVQLAVSSFTPTRACEKPDAKVRCWVRSEKQKQLLSFTMWRRVADEDSSQEDMARCYELGWQCCCRAGLIPTGTGGRSNEGLTPPFLTSSNMLHLAKMPMQIYKSDCFSHHVAKNGSSSCQVERLIDRFGRLRGHADGLVVHVQPHLRSTHGHQQVRKSHSVCFHLLSQIPLHWLRFDSRILRRSHYA